MFLTHLSWTGEHIGQRIFLLHMMAMNLLGQYVKKQNRGDSNPYSKNKGTPGTARKVLTSSRRKLSNASWKTYMLVLYRHSGSEPCIVVFLMNRKSFHNRWMTYTGVSDIHAFPSNLGKRMDACWWEYAAGAWLSSGLVKIWSVRVASCNDRCKQFVNNWEKTYGLVVL